MANVKLLLDEYGIIYEANKILPVEYHSKFIAALAELENNNCHKNREFPITRLHKVESSNKNIYRADIDKMSGWRIHVQYDAKNNYIVLKDIIEGQKHDDVSRIIKSKDDRYQ
jgi:hypothetical protein